MSVLHELQQPEDHAELLDHAAAMLARWQALRALLLRKVFCGSIEAALSASGAGEAGEACWAMGVGRGWWCALRSL